MRVRKNFCRASLGLVLSMAAFAAASAADKAEFIKKPKDLGAEVSRVTVFKGNSAGVINCSGKCYPSDRVYHWTCKEGQGNIIVHCSLSCNPPRGSCLIE